VHKGKRDFTQAFTWYMLHSNIKRSAHCPFTEKEPMQAQLLFMVLQCSEKIFLKSSRGSNNNKEEMIL